MSLSLVLRRKTCHRDGRSKRAYLPMGSADVQRDQAVAAAETVALVLVEDSPLPESAGDVEELAWRLRGHISQLGAVVPPGTSALVDRDEFVARQFLAERCDVGFEHRRLLRALLPEQPTPPAEHNPGHPFASPPMSFPTSGTRS